MRTVANKTKKFEGQPRPPPQRAVRSTFTKLGIKQPQSEIYSRSDIERANGSSTD